MKVVTAFILLGVFASSCRESYTTKYIYSLKDFRPILRQQLERALTLELAERDTSERFLEEQATRSELEKLTLCEHPMLRFKALRVIQHRKGIDRFKIIMNHLDDTAWISVIGIENEIWTARVSDLMLQFGIWDNEKLKNVTVDSVLLHHNYLMNAYTALNKIEPKEKYYKSIREMAGRERPDFSYETSKALYSLAAYQKKEDVPLICRMLLLDNYHLDKTAFNLMQQWPDTAYIPLLIKYGTECFTGQINQNGIMAPISEYLECLASYKNVAAAKMYTLLTRKLKWSYCRADTSMLYNVLRSTYWKNKCDAYKSIMEEIRPLQEKREHQVRLSGDKSVDSFFVNKPVSATRTNEVGWF